MSTRADLGKKLQHVDCHNHKWHSNDLLSFATNGKQIPVVSNEKDFPTSNNDCNAFIYEVVFNLLGYVHF